MRVSFFAAVLLVAAVLAASPVAAQRLPTTVTPDHYDLTFDVDLAGARFSGTETIQVRLSEPSRRIVLNALDMRIEDATVRAAGSTQKAAVSLDTATQTAALVVPKDVPSGPAEIHIRFSAALNKDLRGFYLSKANGRNYAVTQFESTDARRAFPCFDEPAYKATFSVTVTIDQRDNAISNGKLLSDTPGPGAGRHTLKFAESPRMSSYLVAMAVGDFECLEGASENVPIRICATPDKKELGHIALDAAEKILSFYNSYYAVKYPFGKLDAVAVPDFAAGAMENTAAIFYRESDLLGDEKTAAVGNIKRIWEVLAHEMAHQWFGDLVTMRWWDDLWLNEGFATWMEKLPLAAARPEWHMDVDAAADTQRAMALDSLASTRPIHATVETPAQIEESFDAIAYQKGGAVLRMIEGYLGPETFRKGVNLYISRHAYGNATSEDFWTAVAEASGRPVDKIMPTFVNQPGVPLVDVSLTCASSAPRLDLQQQRFFVNAAQAQTTPTRFWEIPFAVKTPSSSSSEFTVLANERGSFDGGRLPAAAGGCPPWVFVNQGAQGYFRSEYAPATLRAMSSDVESRLSAPERLSLVGDEWALVRAGRHSVADFLTLASGYGREQVNGVLGEVTGPLAVIHDYFTTPQTRAPFERFVQTLLRPLYDELGLAAKPGDSDDRRTLRATVIDTLGDVGADRALRAQARQALDAALAGETTLDPTAANAIITIAARDGDAALFDRLEKAAQQATSPDERYRYLYSLDEFDDPALVDRALQLVLTPQVRSQDAALFLGGFLQNPSKNARAWAFVKQHWDELIPKVAVSGGDTNLVTSLGSFCDASARDDIRSFLSTHKLPAASRTIDQTLERINNCVAERARQAPALAEWLAQRSERR